MRGVAHFCPKNVSGLFMARDITLFESLKNFINKNAPPQKFAAGHIFHALVVFALYFLFLINPSSAIFNPISRATQYNFFVYMSHNASGEWLSAETTTGALSFLQMSSR